ncbi:hypothetical protein Leryth_001970 [Lithospermum erythrorhizon]|nr:hypothetical protein Leryth_001970 [Lithospermum erythrorhizon]
MSSLIRLRSRVFRTIPGINYRLCSTLINDQPNPEPIKKPWNFLKYSLLASLTTGLATAGYASYAYSLEEVDEKTKALRSYANSSAAADASSFEKFQGVLTSFAMTVPAKLVELYMDLRRMAEDHVRGFTEPSSEKLLPDLHPQEQGVVTLVLDLNETLIYSDWKVYNL